MWVEVNEIYFSLVFTIKVFTRLLLFAFGPDLHLNSNVIRQILFYKVLVEIN